MFGSADQVFLCPPSTQDCGLSPFAYTLLLCPCENENVTLSIYASFLSVTMSQDHT